MKGEAHSGGGVCLAGFRPPMNARQFFAPRASLPPSFSPSPARLRSLRSRSLMEGPRHTGLLRPTRLAKVFRLARLGTPGLAKAGLNGCWERLLRQQEQRREATLVVGEKGSNQGSGTNSHRGQHYAGCHGERRLGGGGRPDRQSRCVSMRVTLKLSADA